MSDKWGRVAPFSVEATKDDRPIKAKNVLSYSTRPFPGDDLQEYGYFFSIKVGKAVVDIVFSRSQVEEMLAEMFDREVEDIEETMGNSAFAAVADEVEPVFDWDAFWAGLSAETSVEPEPAKEETDDLQALFDGLLAALTYEPTPEQAKARELLDSWGWKDIDYHRDGHLIRAADGTNIHVWHAIAIVEQEAAKARGEFRSATDCPVHGDTLAEHMAGVNA